MLDPHIGAHPFPRKGKVPMSEPKPRVGPNTWSRRVKNWRARAYLDRARLWEAKYHSEKQRRKSAEARLATVLCVLRDALRGLVARRVPRKGRRRKAR